MRQPARIGLAGSLSKTGSCRPCWTQAPRQRGFHVSRTRLAARCLLVVRPTVRPITRNGYPERACLGEFGLGAEPDACEVWVVDVSECPAMDT